MIYLSSSVFLESDSYWRFLYMKIKKCGMHLLVINWPRLKVKDCKTKNKYFNLSSTMSDINNLAFITLWFKYKSRIYSLIACIRGQRIFLRLSLSLLQSGMDSQDRPYVASVLFIERSKMGLFRVWHVQTLSIVDDIQVTFHVVCVCGLVALLLTHIPRLLSFFFNKQSERRLSWLYRSLKWKWSNFKLFGEKRCFWYLVYQLVRYNDMCYGKKN